MKSVVPDMCDKCKQSEKLYALAKVATISVCEMWNHIGNDTPMTVMVLAGDHAAAVGGTGPANPTALRALSARLQDLADSFDDAKREARADT